ncbi:sensor histidine kinase [Oceanithermus sp.]
MKLATRLVLAFALVAIFAGGLTTGLIIHIQGTHVNRYFGQYGPHGFRGVAGEPRNRGMELIRELKNSNLKATAVSLLLAIAVGGYLAWRLSRPVSELTRATRRFAEGDRSARADVSGNDELAELARTFNEMAETLQEQEEQDRRRVADIAHELRTPLAILKGELEALADGMLEATPEQLERLVEEVDHLAMLVEDLRLLSLAESGGLKLQKEPTDLSELVRRTAETFAAAAAARGIELKLDMEPIILEVDPGRMRQVVVNLLDNAIRHASSLVEVGCQRLGDRACITVRDDGPGIAAEDLPHVFDRFYRADPARNRGSGGSGLGLAIVQAIVQAHGGQVTAANHPGGGAVFTTCLPVEPRNEPVAADS